LINIISYNAHITNYSDIANNPDKSYNSSNNSIFVYSSIPCRGVSTPRFSTLASCQAAYNADLDASNNSILSYYVDIRGCIPSSSYVPNNSMKKLFIISLIFSFLPQALGSYFYFKKQQQARQIHRTQPMMVILLDIGHCDT